MKKIFAIIGLVLAVQLSGADVARAQNPSASGLALPRFVSIRGIEVNMRTGPGMQYPVEWVSRLAGLPLEIVAEHKTWRKVRDWEGARGWVHQSMLASKRAFIITEGPVSIRAQPAPESAEIARADSGVVGELRACPEQSGWCRVVADGFEGWLQRTDFWGVLDGETIK